MARNNTGVGLALAASASDSPATPQLYPICGDASIDAEPVTYEGDNNISPDVRHIKRAGEDLSFKVPDISPTPKTLGYLFYLALGGISSATDVHTIVPADAQKYLKVFADDGVDRGSANTTETAIGGKISDLSLEFAEKSFAKMEVSGLACKYGTPAAALVPTLESGANAEPLAWAALQDAAGYFKIGFNGAAIADDGNITGFKMNYTRQLKRVGYDLDNAQPTAINEGKRELTFEVTRDFIDAADLAYLTAWKAGHAVSIELNAVVGTSYVKITIPNAVITGPFGGDIPAALEDDPKRTLTCKAIQKDASPLITVVVKDGFTGNYT